MINPTDMAYVSAGYAPLSARLIQQLASPGLDLAMLCFVCWTHICF